MNIEALMPLGKLHVHVKAFIEEQYKMKPLSCTDAYLNVLCVSVFWRHYNSLTTASMADSSHYTEITYHFLKS